MLPVFSGAKGMEHTGLQGEDCEKCLGQVQHPDGRIHGTKVLSVFGDADKAADHFIKRKKRSCNDHDLPMLFCTVPVDHLKYDAGEGQMHQQDQNAAETVGLPLLHRCFGIFSAKDLKQLDQCLCHIVDAVTPDPG